MGRRQRRKSPAVKKVITLAHGSGGRLSHELARQRAEFHAQGISTETVDWSDRLREALEPHGATGDSIS